MTPEEVLRPFLKRYALPDTVIRLLYLLLKSEIEHDYPALNSNYHPGLFYAKGLDYILSRLPPISDLNDAKLYATIGQLAGITEADYQFLNGLRTNTELQKYNATAAELKEQIEKYQTTIDLRGGEDVSYTRHKLRLAKEKLKELKEPDPLAYVQSFWARLIEFNVSFTLSAHLEAERRNSSRNSHTRTSTNPSSSWLRKGT